MNKRNKIILVCCNLTKRTKTPRSLCVCVWQGQLRGVSQEQEDSAIYNTHMVVTAAVVAAAATTTQQQNDECSAACDRNGDGGEECNKINWKFCIAATEDTAEQKSFVVCSHWIDFLLCASAATTVVNVSGSRVKWRNCASSLHKKSTIEESASTIWKIDFGPTAFAYVIRQLSYGHQ